VRLRTWVLPLSLLAPAAPRALQPEPCPTTDPRRWTSFDTGLLVAELSLTTVDMGQTMRFTRRGVAEQNALVGRHPGRNRVREIWLGSMALQTGGALLLPRPWRTVWQTAWVSGESFATLHNLRFGITIPW
jgi:hypothetical protein